MYLVCGSLRQCFLQTVFPEAQSFEAAVVAGAKGDGKDAEAKRRVFVVTLPLKNRGKTPTWQL